MLLELHPLGLQRHLDPLEHLASGMIRGGGCSAFKRGVHMWWVIRDCSACVGL